MISCLHAVSTQALTGDAAGLSFTPVINPQVLPLQPHQAFSSGRFDRVPIIEGVAENEDGGGGSITEAQFDSSIQNDYGADATRVLNEYPVGSFASPLLALHAVVSDQMACQSLTTSNELSRWVPTHTYEYDDPTVLHYGSTEAARDVLAGAYHSSELPALFPGWDAGLANGPVELMVGADQQAMREQMMDYWGAFARQGAPEPAQAANWPAYHGNPAPHAMVMSLEPADNSHPEAASQISADHNCGFWAGISEN